jgi:putative transposase
MDGRGAWRDNVFVERLWRSVKYERVYLKAYDSVSAARADIAEYLSLVQQPGGRIRASIGSRPMSSTSQRSANQCSKAA